MTAIVPSKDAAALASKPQDGAVESSELDHATPPIERTDGPWDEFDRITYDEHVGRPPGDVIARKHRGDPL